MEKRVVVYRLFNVNEHSLSTILMMMRMMAGFPEFPQFSSYTEHKLSIIMFHVSLDFGQATTTPLLHAGA